MMEVRMSNPATFLRTVLTVDSIGCAVSGAALIAGASLLAAPLGLSFTLLEGAGIILLPFAGLLGWLASRETPPATGVWAVILLNALWVIESLVLAIGSGAQPTTLGVVVIIGQALMGAILAALEFIGLKRLRPRLAQGLN
jgi:hypothetical protein